MRLGVLVKRLFHAITTRYLDWIAAFGVWAMGLSTLLESAGIPGTTIAFELGAGPLIVSGQARFATVVVIATGGLFVGSMISYALGYYGRDVLNRFLDETRRAEREAQRAAIKSLLDRYGPVAIFLAQLFGPLRTWGSYPAGFYRVNVFVFGVFTILGGAVYSTAITLLSLFYYSAAKEISLRLLARFGVPLWAVYAVAGVVFVVLAIASAKLATAAVKRVSAFTEDSQNLHR